MGRSRVTNWPGVKSKEVNSGTSIQYLFVSAVSFSMRITFPVRHGNNAIVNVCGKLQRNFAKVWNFDKVFYWIIILEVLIEFSVNIFN